MYDYSCEEYPFFRASPQRYPSREQQVGTALPARAGSLYAGMFSCARPGRAAASTLPPGLVSGFLDPFH